MCFNSKQAMICHGARYHQRLRYARARAIGRTCTVCLRKFGSRSQLLEHLHTSSVICLVNTMLNHPQLTAEEAEQADWKQWEHEAANRTSGLSTNHSDEAFTILSGPLKRMVIPIGHPRRCKYKLFEEYLKGRGITI